MLGKCSENSAVRTELLTRICKTVLKKARRLSFLPKPTSPWLMLLTHVLRLSVFFPIVGQNRYSSQRSQNRLSGKAESPGNQLPPLNNNNNLKSSRCGSSQEKSFVCRHEIIFISRNCSFASSPMRLDWCVVCLLCKIEQGVSTWSSRMVLRSRKKIFHRVISSAREV